MNPLSLNIILKYVFYSLELKFKFLVQSEEENYLISLLYVEIILVFFMITQNLALKVLFPLCLLSHSPL